MLVGNFIIHNLYDPINSKIIELKEDYAFPIYGPIGLTMLCNCMSLIEDCIGNMNFVCIFLPPQSCQNLCMSIISVTPYGENYTKSMLDLFMSSSRD